MLCSSSLHGRPKPTSSAILKSGVVILQVLPMVKLVSIFAVLARQVAMLVLPLHLYLWIKLQVGE